MKRLILVGCSAGALVLAGCASESAPGQPTTPDATTEPVNLLAPPVAISVNGTEAPVDSSPIGDDGVLHPPEDVSRLVWWKDSARPGTPGTVVVTGHVNLHGQDGYAKQFLDMKPGTRVEVDTSDGDVETYTVTEVSNYNKASEFPAEKLNALEGPETLALITCGGEYIGAPFGYEDNVIVWAVND